MDLKENIYQKSKEKIKTGFNLKESVYINKAKAFLKRVPPKYKIIGILITFFTLWIWGIFAQLFYLLSHFDDKNFSFTFNPLFCVLKIITCGFDSAVWGLVVITAIFLLYKLWYYKNHRFDPKTEIIYRNGKSIRRIVNEGTLTTDRELTIDELDKKFVHTYEPSAEHSVIFGRNMKDRRTVMAPYVPRDSERNVAIFGGAGSGKTTCFIYSAIAGIAKMGDNIICTDPSGEIFATNYNILKSKGYEIKVLNTQMPENSDGWNFCGEMGQDYSFAQMCAKTILDNTNTGQGTVQFWEEGMDNLLAALILYVNYLGNGNNTITQIVSNILAKKKLNDITALFNTLDVESPARQAYELFMKEVKNANNVLENLGLRLKIFLEPERAALCSTDDIHISDLANPDKKTAVFIITHDLDNTYQLISALFIDMAYKILTDIAKKNDDGSGNVLLPKSVHLVIDEFLNIGHINDMGKKLSAGRKYGVVWYLVIQSLAQFIRRDRYSAEEAEEILNNTKYKLVFAAEDTTAEYFSKKSGEMTVLTYQNTLDNILFRTVSNARSTQQKRPVFTVGEISTLNNEGHYLILFTKETFCVELEKFYYRDLDDFRNLPKEESFFHIRRYRGTMYDKILQIRKKINGGNSELSSIRKNFSPEIPKPQPTIEIKPKLDNQHIALQNKSLYEKDGKPRFVLPPFEDDVLSRDLQLSLPTVKDNNLDEINKIPPIQRIKWEPLLKNFDGLIYKENGSVKFKKNNKIVYLLFFKSYAQCLENVLPMVQFRASREPLDIGAITNGLGHFSDKYYIDYWTACYHKNDKHTERWGVGQTMYMPSKHITLVPHLDLIENRKEPNLFSPVYQNNPTDDNSNQNDIPKINF